MGGHAELGDVDVGAATERTAGLAVAGPQPSARPRRFSARSVGLWARQRTSWVARGPHREPGGPPSAPRSSR